MCVTARWDDADWQFHVTFKPIRMKEFETECQNALSTQFKFITEQVIDLDLKYLFRLYNLPQTMKQIPYKHSIVILDAPTPNKKRYLKFTPRSFERELAYLPFETVGCLNNNINVISKVFAWRPLALLAIIKASAFSETAKDWLVKRQAESSS